MIIKVTQKHIDKGCVANQQYCPIALAIGEALNLSDQTEIKVNRAYIDIGIYKRRRMSPEVRAFIIAFDNGEKVKPFKFELNLS